MQITTLIYNVALLFIMMVPGVIMMKARLCDEGFGKGISNLVLFIAQPALIVYAYIDFSGSFSDIWLNVVSVFLLSLAAHIIFSIVALLFFKRAPDAKRRMLRFVTVFANAAFMGIPLVQAILGSELAIYASVYNISFNIFLWTFGVYLCTEGTDEDGDGVTDGDAATDYHGVRERNRTDKLILKLLIHPVTIASAVGIILLACGVNTTAYELGLFSDCLLMLKNLVAPLSMLVIGLRLARVDFRGVFRDKYLYEFLFLRHIFLPAVIIGIIKLLGLVGMTVNSDVALVTVILAATPAATSATMFAVKYDCDAEYTTKLVTVSTLLSIATMPVMVWLASL